jgi:hypothetical protein
MLMRYCVNAPQTGLCKEYDVNCNIQILVLIDIVDTISNSNALVARTLYSTTDLDFGSHRAHRVGGAKHSLVVRVARAVDLRRTGSAIAGRRCTLIETVAEFASGPESMLSGSTELGAESGRWVGFGKLNAIRDPPSFRPGHQAWTRYMYFLLEKIARDNPLWRSAFEYDVKKTATRLSSVFGLSAKSRSRASH